MLSVHSPSSLFPRMHIINRSFLAPTLCFVGDRSVKLFFVEGRGERSYSKNEDRNSFFDIYGKTFKKNPSILRSVVGRRRASNKQKVRAKNSSKQTNSSVLPLVEGRRRAPDTQKARAQILRLSIIGVNSDFPVYRNNSKRSIYNLRRRS